MPLRNPTCVRKPGYVRFSIDSVYGDSAEVTVKARPCGVSRVQEEEEDGTLTVYDGLGCLLDEDEEDLIDRAGFAVRVEDDTSGECRWEILSLCCQ